MASTTIKHTVTTARSRKTALPDDRHATGTNLELIFLCFNKLVRTIAYRLRLKNPKQHRGPLSTEELEGAHDRIIRSVQHSHFPTELHDLRKFNKVNSKSRLLPLNPFLDEQGIMRVGGRLHRSNLPYNRRHQIIIPKTHHVTSLIISQYHRRNFHAGTLATLHCIRQKYWPLDGRNQIRFVLRKCIQCFRANPPVSECIMGQLPAARVTQSRPFETVGVDYCGPFMTKEKKFRNRKSVKTYVAVFVSLAVKAVHLEVVSDLITDGFIAAFRRFIARRGKCREITSDSASSFVGAKNQLAELYADPQHTNIRIRSLR
ncbi:PREDICTED: uncharacterized protein LOC108554662, partial [Eufriesea mexicana]|uniref:uncharacterized protein LOC108554662 n=1 Tax=Eufriesea mexicana TaxID=516756 RepID=UPI00083C0DAC